MSRRRYLSTDISTDARVAALAEHGALPVLLYTWAIPHADDWGRLTGDARQFKLLVCPGFDVTARDVEVALSQIAEAGLWLRYSIEGRACIAFPPAAWFRYQTYIGREKRGSDGSTIPAPPDAAYQFAPSPALSSALHAGEQAREQEERDAQASTIGQDIGQDINAVGLGSAEQRVTPWITADHRKTPLHARTPSPSPSPSPSPTLSSDGQAGSGERERVLGVRDADVALAAEQAADAARSLSAPAPSAAALASVATVVAIPSNVTPLPIAARPPATVASAAGTSGTAAGGKATARVHDPVWDACIAAMGAAPSNRVERGRWAKGIQALKESLVSDGSPTEAFASEISVRANRYRARFGSSVPLNPMALAGNWTTLAHDIPQEDRRHGNIRHGETAQGPSGAAACGRSAGRGGGRSGKPAIGSPAYYAAALAQQASQQASERASQQARDAGGGTGQGQRDAVVG